MQKVGGKWKYLLLAAMIFCTGLYFGTAQTVPLFGYQSVTSTDSKQESCLYTPDNTYDEAQWCTGETIGIRNILCSPRFEKGGDSARRATASLSDVLSYPFLVLHHFPGWTNIWWRSNVLASNQEMVSTFIHKTDGKK